MPVNGGVLIKLILDDDAHGLALPQPNLRPGKTISISPNISAEVRLSYERPARGRCEQLELSDRRRILRLSGKRCRGGSTCRACEQ
jgi:hypothetical protein